MRLYRRARRDRERGQSMIEFAMVVPVIATMLCAVLEFGFAFDTNIALEAASREGARVGAGAGNGGSHGACPFADANAVDAAIVNAAQRSLQKAQVDMTTVHLRIYLSDANGNIQGGKVNDYVWDSTDPATAHFIRTGESWPACGRHDGTFAGGAYDSVGVEITYTYTSRTGLLAVFSGGVPMTARAVMPIGPPAG